MAISPPSQTPLQFSDIVLCCRHSCQRSNASWWSCNQNNAYAPAPAIAGSLANMLPSLPNLRQPPASQSSTTATQPSRSLFSPATAAKPTSSLSAPQTAPGQPAQQLASVGSQSPMSATRPAPVDGSKAPQASLKLPTLPASGQLSSGSSFPVVAMGQCGGSTSYCASLEGSQCKDAPWMELRWKIRLQHFPARTWSIVNVPRPNVSKNNSKPNTRVPRVANSQWSQKNADWYDRANKWV